jgi:hypothetical protein
MLLAGALGCLEAGRRIGLHARRLHPKDADVGNGAVDGAVYGLLGLLLAFTFSGAAARFDARRELMGKEANAISTAYLRLDTLPAEAQAPLKAKFREYADSRIAFFTALPDVPRAKAEIPHYTALQEEIWTQAVVATRLPGAAPSSAYVVLPPINEMIDITTTQRVALETHPPLPIFVMLGALALVSSLVAGHAMSAAQGHHWLHIVVFAGVLSSAGYMILELEYPRYGLVKVQNADERLLDARKGMN